MNVDKRSRPLTTMSENKPNNFGQSFYEQNKNANSNNNFFINDCHEDIGEKTRGDYKNKSKYNNFNQTSRPQSSKVSFGNHNKTVTFFKNTKVDSCSHIVETKGRTFAVPYTVRNPKGRPLSAYKYTIFKKPQQKSIYAQDYCVKRNCNVGMSNKPLQPYDPNSTRSRLPIPDFFMAQKNSFYNGTSWSIILF